MFGKKEPQDRDINYCGFFVCFFNARKEGRLVKVTNFLLYMH